MSNKKKLTKVHRREVRQLREKNKSYGKKEERGVKEENQKEFS